MGNNKYKKAANEEREIMNYLRKEGWISARSAGSHSAVDVWAVHPTKKVFQCIQLKPESMSRKARDKIEVENSGINGLNMGFFRCLTKREFFEAEQKIKENQLLNKVNGTVEI